MAALHRGHGLPRHAEQQPERRRATERHPDQDGERRADLHARRRPRARWLRHADEYRAHQWRARHAAHHPAQRQRLHARYREWREEVDARHPGQRASGDEDQSAFRSVHLRLARHRERVARRPHRRGSHRRGHPPFPRFLAQHAHRAHLHPTLDPHLRRRAQRAGLFDQRDDPRRPRAGHRHPRR